MSLSGEIQEFIVGNVMIIIGTRNETNRASIARGMGARAIGEDGVEVLVSGGQWAETIANLRSSPFAAITFARPLDYVSYQLKGEIQCRAADGADTALARAYRSGMMAMFATLGLPEDFVSPWFSDEDLCVIRLRVRESYVQTPGPRAGTAL